MNGPPRLKKFPSAMSLASAVRSLRQIDHKADDDRLLQLSIRMFLKFYSVDPSAEGKFLMDFVNVDIICNVQTLGFSRFCNFCKSFFRVFGLVT